jgi:AAA ATPase domain
LPEQRAFAGTFSRAVEQACRERDVDQRWLADAIARIQYRGLAHSPERDDRIRRASRSWESRISAWKSGQRLPASEADLRAALRVIAPGTLASDWLDLWKRARRQQREQPPEPDPGRDQPTAPAAGTGPAEVHHWQVSAGETAPGAGTPFLFTGRVSAIAAISAWLTDSDEPRVCLVTGDPGSGKSAVLSWFALQEALGDRHRFQDRENYPRLPERAITAAVHARGRDLTDIVQDIARQANVNARDVESLARALAERGRKIVVLLDAADEAENAERQLVPKLVLPIVRGWAGQPLRLLIGARQHIARRLPASVTSVNLDDPRFIDDDDLRTYVTRVLSRPRTHAASWATDGNRVARVAAAIARNAARSYLVAQLVAGAVVERGDLPSPDQPFPHDVAEAMQYYLAALPLDQLEAEDLLRPLAFARGEGLPAHLWSALASRLSGRSPDDAARAITDLFYGPLASLIEVSRPPVPESTGPARYRLFHEALDEYVASTLAAFPSAAQPGLPRREAFAAALLAAVPVRTHGAPDWPAADPYIRRHIAAHAIGTGVLAELMDDALFLICGDPGVIVPALRGLVENTAAVQAYQAFASLFDPATPLAERAALLALAAEKTGSGELARTWDAATRPFQATAPWWPVAARWRAVARHRVVRAHLPAA